MFTRPAPPLGARHLDPPRRSPLPLLLKSSRATSSPRAHTRARARILGQREKRGAVGSDLGKTSERERERRARAPRQPISRNARVRLKLLLQRHVATDRDRGLCGARAREREAGREPGGKAGGWAAARALDEHRQRERERPPTAFVSVVICTEKRG